MRTVLIAAVALLSFGCSFSYSSKSSVKALTSPSRSSKSSSGDEEKKEAYRDDVRDFTAAYAGERSPGQDLHGFTRGLAEVALRHGVTDWEADDATYVAVGAGLKRAAVGDAQRVEYETVVGGGAPATALLRSGYGS